MEPECCLQISAGLLKGESINLGLIRHMGLNQHQAVESTERLKSNIIQNLLALNLTKDGLGDLERWGAPLIESMQKILCSRGHLDQSGLTRKNRASGRDIV